MIRKWLRENPNKYPALTVKSAAEEERLQRSTGANQPWRIKDKTSLMIKQNSEPEVGSSHLNAPVAAGVEG
ncbi:hypothetical protein ATANTOWER_008454 [Ataeniobius toweri]|uniref:Uncharacterized protein n=1 Tax=Ataeniobius toweri TaxID=208326 RepID=A0ABU7CFE3_9TELE|nr:hypothetical protein [Ataeniobius toweri]